MLANVKNVFKVADLRNKVLFTIAMVGLYRLGVAIQVPGVDQVVLVGDSQGARRRVDLEPDGRDHRLVLQQRR